MSFRRTIIALLLAVAVLQPLSAQRNRGQTDSVVVLMNAKSLELLESASGMHYRKAIEARFLHNNTYLVCDSALWNVDMRIINAFGNVQIIQDRTVLSSERLDYIIDDDLAQDKDGNTLRTRYLDYNTRDSVAVFERGASMRDKDGQVIESTNGTYDSKEKLFTFERNVNMYTDSVYVSTRRLLYHTDYDFAEFFGGLDAWKGKNMLSSEEGSYDKANDRFFFTDDVHIMSDTQEGWADSLYFDRSRNDIEMYGNVQVMDTTRNVSALSKRLFYVDSLSQVTLEREAAVIAETDQDGQIDTVYMGADYMVYWTVPKCDINGNIVAAAEKRLTDIAADPVAAYRGKNTKSSAPASEQGGNGSADTGSISQKAAEADIESLKIDNEMPVEEDERMLEEASDSLSVNEPVLLDSLAMAEKARLDSVARAEQAVLDSIAEAEALAAERELFVKDSLASRDTTAIGFLRATGHIRMFKSDMQARSDSLEYTDLDSLARLFLSPIVWNEGNRQYTSDSLTISVKNQRMDKASLMSNAFIIIQEDTMCFDQIRGTEIMAYFDSTTALKRFDALGGSSALFYLKENDAFATVNKVEAKMITADFVEGEIDRISYFDSPKNDAYPLVQLPEEERQMKGFNWQPDIRPKGKEVVRRIAWAILGKNLLQQRRLERTQQETPRIPSVKRLAVIEEDLVHQPIDAAADDQIDSRIGVMLIPYRRYLAKYRWINPVKLLEFVQDNRKPTSLRCHHENLEKIGKRLACPQYPQMKCLLDFRLQFLAERLLVLPSNRQMYVWNHAIFKRMAQKRRLSNTAAAGNDNKLRFCSRIFPHSAKHLDFFCSADKLHTAPLKNVRFENGCFENGRIFS